MAAQSKFTPAVGQAICDRVRRGVPIGVAASAEGVSRARVYDWKRRGENGEPRYTEFAVELERAMADVETQITENVIMHAASDWKAGAFWLKCRNRELYGEEVTVRHMQQGMQRMCEDLQPHMSEGAFREMLHAIGKTMGVGELAAGEAAAAEARAHEDDGLH